jgi:hypothetical protein
MAVDRIMPDEQAILALERVTTGANVHGSKQLINVYKDWCSLGNTEEADKAKRAMWERALDLGRRLRPVA